MPECTSVSPGDRVTYSTTKAGYRFQGCAGEVTKVKNDEFNRRCISVKDNETGEVIDLYPETSDTIEPIMQEPKERPIKYKKPTSPSYRKEDMEDPRKEFLRRYRKGKPTSMGLMESILEDAGVLDEDHATMPPAQQPDDYDNASTEDADSVKNPSDYGEIDDEAESQPVGTTTYKRSSHESLRYAPVHAMVDLVYAGRVDPTALAEKLVDEMCGSKPKRKRRK